MLLPHTRHRFFGYQQSSPLSAGQTPSRVKKSTKETPKNSPSVAEFLPQIGYRLLALPAPDFALVLACEAVPRSALGAKLRAGFASALRAA